MEQDPDINTSLENQKVGGKGMKLSGDVVKQPEINITEEMNKSGMWKSLEPKQDQEIKAKK